MMMDPQAEIRGAGVFQAGIHTGKVIGYLKNGAGIMCRGISGPHQVLVPARILDVRTPVGTEIVYEVKLGRRFAVATRLVKTQSMGSAS